MTGAGVSAGFLSHGYSSVRADAADNTSDARWMLHGNHKNNTSLDFKIADRKYESIASSGPTKHEPRHSARTWPEITRRSRG